MKGNWEALEGVVLPVEEHVPYEFQQINAWSKKPSIPTAYRDRIATFKGQSMAARYIEALLNEESLRRHGWASSSCAHHLHASSVVAQHEGLVTVAKHRPPLQASYHLDSACSGQIAFYLDGPVCRSGGDARNVPIRAECWGRVP